MPVTGYACDVACPKCGARIGEACTFKHWNTGQRIATFYCRERHEAMRHTAPNRLAHGQEG